MQHERRGRLDAQLRPRVHRGDLPVALPDLDARTRRPAEVTIRDLRDEIEYAPVRRRAQQLDVLAMRPHQRHCRAGLPSATEQLRRDVSLIPNLFRQQPRAVGKSLDRADIWADVASRREFVMPALAGEQRPWPAPAGPGVGAAVVALAVSVMG